MGRAAAADPPAWAVEALGPVPNARTERDDWEERAGVVAAYCELRGHDYSGDALGNLEVRPTWPTASNLRHARG